MTIIARAALLLAAAGCGGSTTAGDGSGGGTGSGAVGDATTGADGPGALDAATLDATTQDAASGDDGGFAPDGGTASCPSLHDASPVAPGRAPMNHRSARSTCSHERAPETATACGCPDGGLDPIPEPDGGFCLCGSCGQDSDCTAGNNGRCGEVGPGGFLRCSYDACFADSDCPGGAPCECRGNAASPNVCQTGGDCAVDSDCGPAGYCSPSLVNSLCFCSDSSLCGDAGDTCTPGQLFCTCGDSCDHGYFCHTPCDTCVDDSDCEHSGTCNFNSIDHRWECQVCFPVP
jgi:hypothetical protein